MIKLSGVGKNFGDYWAIKDLDIEVAKGKIFGFLGPNGAGKTTTVKMIAGLLKPAVGQIFAGGYDVVAEPLKAKSIIGYVPDKGFLYEKLTGREFLRFVAALYKMPEEQTAGKIKGLSETFSIREILDGLIESYSAGMRQRLVFVAAMLNEPKILLIDEPIVGLDPKGIRMLKNLLQGQAAGGLTIFMATHSLLLAEELCSDIGIINNGRLIASGTKEGLLSSGRRLEDFFLQVTEK
ncbi:MAG: ABC transporter ATP-binding protein [Nitrospirae bacterium]|nr:ABC transporter ATP-binding protein [Nitrospirota bacterium]